MIKHLFFGLSQTCKQLMTLLQLIRIMPESESKFSKSTNRPKGEKWKSLLRHAMLQMKKNLFFFQPSSKTFTLIFTAKKSYSYMGTNLIKPASGFFFMNFFPNPVIHYGKSPKNIQPSHSEAPNCPPVIEA